MQQQLLQLQQQQQLQLTDAPAVADTLKLQQQLPDAQALEHSAQADARKLQKQLVGSSMSAELDDKKEQLAEAQAAAQSASVHTKLGQMLQQQRIELQENTEQLSGASCFAQC